MHGGVGYDNYGHGLEEPGLGKTEAFMEKLGGFTEVVRKSIRQAAPIKEIVRQVR